MSSKISNTEWGLVIGFAAMIDLIQFILNLFVIGLAVNRIINFVIGPSLALYYKIRGVKMNSKKVGSLVGSFALELIPVLDVLPAWTGNVVMTMLWDKAEKKGTLPQKTEQ